MDKRWPAQQQLTPGQGGSPPGGTQTAPEPASVPLHTARGASYSRFQPWLPALPSSAGKGGLVLVTISPHGPPPHLLEAVRGCWDQSCSRRTGDARDLWGHCCPASATDTLKPSGVGTLKLLCSQELQRHAMCPHPCSPQASLGQWGPWCGGGGSLAAPCSIPSILAGCE